MKVGLFPGQGVAVRAVLEALPERDPSLDVADELLGYGLRAQVESYLRRSGSPLPTRFAQPAIFVASVISWESRKSSNPCSFLIGHSLGEYAALVAGGAISFRQCLMVVRTRAEAMERASAGQQGGMAAVLGLTDREVLGVTDASGAAIANDNAPGQVVIAGSDQQLGHAAELTRSAGGRAVRLDVAAPFHTSAMEPAQNYLQDALFRVEFHQPRVPVISNVTARPYRAPGEIRQGLVSQLTSRVLFRQALDYVWSNGARTAIDLGPGDVVGALAARTFRSHEVVGSHVA